MPKVNNVAARKEPLCGSSRFMIVICSLLLIINVVFSRISFGYNYLCMSNEPGGDSNQVNMTMYNKKHGVGTFVWSKELAGYLLSSYFVGYVISCVIGGFVSDIWGGRKPIVWGNAFAVIFLFAEVPAAYISPYVFFICRMINGFCSGMSYSPVYTLFSKWIHPSERALLVGITFAGFPIGTIITYPLASFLCQYGFRGWESNFYIPGVIGLFSQMLFCRFIYDNPQKHPRISEKEKLFLSSIEPPMKTTASIPCCRLCRSMPIIAYVVAQTAQVWNWQSMAINMPTYYKEVFHLEGNKNALASCLPFAALLVVRMAIALTFDKFFVWTGLSITRFRKINYMIGSLIPSMAIIGLTFLDRSHYILATILMIVDQAVVDFAVSGGFLATLLDLAPQYAGIISGIATTISFCSSIISPIITGYLTKNKTQEEWNKVFYIQAGILLFSCIFYQVFGSSERLKWLRQPSETPGPAVTFTMSATSVSSVIQHPVRSAVSFHSVYGIEGVQGYDPNLETAI